MINLTVYDNMHSVSQMLIIVCQLKAYNDMH
jgi:hypothetical protein